MRCFMPGLWLMVIGLDGRATAGVIGLGFDATASVAAPAALAFHVSVI
jgi:hypothetical protein